MFYIDHSLLSEEAFHSEYEEKDLKFCGGSLNSGVVIVLLKLYILFLK